MLLLMGFFATYMGLIYNDFMSIPLQLFGEGCYKVVPGQSLMAKTDEHCIYPFGMDPSWMNSTNDIAFYNSFKMKAAVILGVSHMLIGLGCKGLNAVHFNRKLDFLHEFLPQVIMLCALFGFMNTLVVVKWTTDWQGREDVAPSIIGIMIDMFVNLGEPQDPRQMEVISGQKAWSRCMLFLAVVTPPWMLFAKPLLLKRENEEK